MARSAGDITLSMLKGYVAVLCGLLSASTAWAGPAQQTDVEARVRWSGGVEAQVTASSTLKSRPPGRYSVKNAFDGDPATAWVEGARGIDAVSILVQPSEVLRLYGIVLWPGYTKSLSTLRNNAIPGRLSLHHQGWDEDEHEHGFRTDALHYRLEVVARRGQPPRCAMVARDPVNLSPRLMLSRVPDEVRAFQLTLDPLSADEHRPRYADLALSEWMPLFHIVDEEHRELVEVSSPLTSPLREVVELLLQYGDVRHQHPERLPLAPDARLVSFFDVDPTGLPTWAREALHARLREQGADPAQDAATQFGKAVAAQFFERFITVQPLPGSGHRLVGGPYMLRRERPTASPLVEYAFVFPVLTLNAAFQVMKAELKTSGLSGENCERSLPPL